MSKPYYDWSEEEGYWFLTPARLDQDTDNHAGSCPAGGSYHGPWFYGLQAGQPFPTLPDPNDCPICFGTNMGLPIPFKDLGFDQ